MRISKKNVLMLTSSTLAFVAAMAIPRPAAADQIIKIGFSAPLTGPQASSGQDNLGGMKMAIDRLNAEGIRIGGQKVEFRAVIEDDQGDPRAGMSAVQKLIDTPVDAVIGPYNSGVVIPTSRLLNDAGIVTLTVASNPKITEQGYDSLFRVAPSDSQLGGKMAVYAARELKVKRVAVVDDRTAYGQGLAKEFAKIAKANGMQIVGMEYTNDKATDFNAILTAIKGKRPDAIFYGGYAPQGGPMRRQMRQLGMDALLLGGESICSPEMGRLGGPAVDDKVYCARSGGMLNRSDDAKNFAADYQKQFQRSPEVFAAAYYDAMMLLAHAMQAAGVSKGEKLRAEMKKINYNGVAGSYAFDAKHDLKESPVTIFQFKAGLPAPIGSY
ncbi:MAG: branched-chain amino acid transporter substrate-binding protein [Herbaspirillum sp.]|jgi:branched-chain amino acid transport system substrate-binding protein|nr:branched-chain amino acid transporter substrate-binding protein [Herbaspirillum sp.]